jgi:RHS repeat-associated protein
VTRATDALGRTVGLDHDAGGNLVRVTDPLGHRREMTYDATGRVRTATDALGGVARLEYDAGGRLQAAVDAAGTRLRFDVDASGRPVSMTDAAGGTTRLEYAATGEVVAVVDPLGRRTSFEYDAASRLVRRRDALGGLVTLAYDALDRIVQLTDATGTVRYDYDANGNLVAVTDPLGRRVQYEYDAMDRRVARTDAVGVTTRFTYDAMGNLVAAVDGQGRTTVYEHDLLGRRVTIVDGHGARTELGYDASGRLLRATADGQTVLFEHDALGRVTAETTMLGTTRYTWDAGGRRATMTRPDGTVVGYSHDAAARPTGITRGRDSVALVYDDAGRRRRLSLPGGIEVEYAHDVGSRLVAITYRRGPTVLGTLSHAYDELDRRITVSGSLADVALPRPLADAAYDDANRPLHVGEHRLAHDAAGNVTRWTSPDGDWIFSWDARGRLTAASGPNERLTFAYDALGRRTAVERDGRLTAFGYDGGDVVEDVAADGERRYLRGLGVDELFAVDDAAALTDGLGSLLRMIDADGRVRDAVAYEPFGRTTSGAVGTRYGFTGRERDTSDLYHYRARYYHAGLGRFLSEDPLGLTAGINAYVYAFNDPVNLVDPSGLRTYVLHGIWPDRAAFDQFAGALREADPATTTLRWNGSLLGGVVPSTRSVAADLVPQILADLDADPLAAGEKLNLIGFSGGGLVAASLAEMLRARGVKVDTVVTMGTPAHTPITARVPSETRLMNFIGAFDPLVSFRLHPRGTNHLVLATHTARSYTENARVLALVKREIAR